MLTHPNIVTASRATRIPVEAVKPLLRFSGWLVTVDPGIVVICVAVLMKLALVAGVWDVVAVTCVAFVGHTVRLTVWVMVCRIRHGMHVHLEEQKLDHSCFLQSPRQLHIPVSKVGISILNHTCLVAHLLSLLPLCSILVVTLLEQASF